MAAVLQQALVLAMAASLCVATRMSVGLRGTTAAFCYNGLPGPSGVYGRSRWGKASRAVQDKAGGSAYRLTLRDEPHSLSSTWRPQSWPTPISTRPRSRAQVSQGGAHSVSMTDGVSSAHIGITSLSAGRVRVFAVSDLHADYKPNMEWLKNLPLEKAGGACGEDSEGGAKDMSILVFAGDMATELSTLEAGLRTLKSKYDHVLFVPGNHELWCQRGDGERAPDSIAKLEDVLDVCARCGVYTEPLLIRIGEGEDAVEGEEGGEGAGGKRRFMRVMLLPFLSWYHAGFDKEPPLPPSTLKQIEIPGLRPFQERWGDFKRCSWPTSIAPTGCEWNSLESPSQHVAEAFARMNDAAWLPQVLDQLSPDDMVVSISHFVPRLELVPEKRFLVSPDLPKVVGSDPLERQIRSVQAQLGLKSAEKRGGDRVGVGEGEGGSAMTKQEVQHMHVFGHTHLPVDLTLEGIRYMQWSLGMQRKGKDIRSCKIVHDNGPLEIFDSREGWCDRVSTLWGDYYQRHARDPANATLAPWVRAFAEETKRRIQKRREGAAQGAQEQQQPQQQVAASADGNKASEMAAASTPPAPASGGAGAGAVVESRRREAREGEGASAEAGAVKNNSVSSSLSHKVCASNQEYMSGDVSAQIRKQREWLDLPKH